MVDSSRVPRVDGIEIVEEVGQGGFATVYRGRQPAFHRDVAVKVLQQSRLDSDDRRRFERECQAMGALSGHPFIVTLYDAGFTADERPYLVMPYIADGTLHDRLASGPMPWQEVLMLGIHLAGALETAHRAGVIHRDIKPGNVLRSEYGNQLSDFGIARLQGGHETQSGVITASISHAPPEILDGHAPSEQSDVYSLGSTLFEALTGRSAFERTADETLLALVRRVISQPVPDLRTHGVPAIFAATLERAMAKEPTERYSSAESFGRALQQAQSTLGLSITDLVIVGARRETAESAPIVAAIPPPGSDSGTASPPRVPEPPPALADSSPSSLQVTSVLAADDDPPSTPPAKRRLTTVLLPIAVGGAVAAAIGIFALWPRDRSDADPDTAVPTVVDSPASSADESVNTVDSGSEPTVATEPTRDAVTTTAEPVVTARPGPAEAFLVATVDVDATTNVDGFEFTAIDGLGYDPVGGRMLAAREAAPLAEQEANSSLATPAVFAVPLNLVGPQSATLGFSSASAAPLVDASGEPYGPELDLEGMVGLGDGSFYVVSEGSTESGGLSSTFVHRFDPDARFQSALLLPDWYVSNPETQTGFSPEQGLHGIDQRPGSAGQVVVAVEAPLLQDHDPDQPTESKVARLIAFDIETGVPTAEWAYPLDLISPTVAAAEPTAASLIIDIAALGDDSIVVLESTRTEAGRQVALYRVVLDAGSTPGPETPAPLQKSPIAVSGMDSLSQFRSISAGPRLPDGEPSLLLATDNAFDGSPTQIAILSVDEES